MENNTLLAVFAHPDDEAFRCGGTLALLAQRGVSVHLLTFTRGQAGSPGDPPICAPGDLGAVRTDELYCSCQALGLETPQVLDYADGALTDVGREEGVSQIVACIQSHRPQVLLTWPSHGLSGHPDHKAVSRWTLEAFHQSTMADTPELTSLYYLAFPISLAEKLGMDQLHTMPDPEITISINIESVWEQKMAAINCHQTQIGESPILRSTLDKQKLFLGVEHFFRAESRASGDVLMQTSLDMKGK